jgi:hypothetical protein
MAFRKVFEFKEITLEYSSNGASSLQFLTDMPAGAVPGALAARLGAGAALPSTTTVGARQTMTIPLDGIRGTQYQPKVTPGTTTQMEIYSGVVYARPIGVYLDGSLTIPEIWQTVPLAPGAGGA